MFRMQAGAELRRPTSPHVFNSDTSAVSGGIAEQESADTDYHGSQAQVRGGGFEGDPPVGITLTVGTRSSELPHELVQRELAPDFVGVLHEAAVLTTQASARRAHSGAGDHEPPDRTGKYHDRLPESVFSVSCDGVAHVIPPARS
jgi:hypothetical protein